MYKQNRTAPIYIIGVPSSSQVPFSPFCSFASIHTRTSLLLIVYLRSAGVHFVRPLLGGTFPFRLTRSIAQLRTHLYRVVVLSPRFPCHSSMYQNADSQKYQKSVGTLRDGRFNFQKNELERTKTKTN